MRTLEPLEQALVEALALPASLDKRLAHFKACLAREAPDYAETYERLIGRLAASGLGGASPKVGERMPDFALPDRAGRLVGMAELLARGPLVVTFKRGRWCEFCRIEIDALVKAYSKIRALDAEVVAIVPEAAPEFASLDATGSPLFPLLTDVDCGYALTLGLAMPVDQELAEMLRRDGIDLAASHAGSGYVLPLPATFVVAMDGRIVARFVSADFRIRMQTDEILSALRELPRNKPSL